MSDCAIKAIGELENLLFGSTLDLLKAQLDYDKRLGALWSAIESNYCEIEFDLTKASKACGMSRNNLNSMLKRATGKHTFYELLTAYRIYRSCIAAVSSNETFTEIALSCGFDNSSSYSRAAKRYLKMPPSSFLPREGNQRKLRVVRQWTTPIY